MKFSALLCFIIYYCFYVSEVNSSTIDVYNAITILSSNSIWKNSIEPVRLIENRKIVTAQNYQHEFNNLQSANINKNTNDKSNLLVYKNLKAMYTALKCKYSNLIITTYLNFFDSITLCDNLAVPEDENNDDLESRAMEITRKQKCIGHITENIIKLKTYIGRMVFNLMYFMTISPNLKSTDHTLIMSLVSINLYLYQTKIKSESSEVEKEIHDGKVLKKVIAQKINLVEIFNSKYCYVENITYKFKSDLKEKMHKTGLNEENLYSAIDTLFYGTIRLNFKPLHKYIKIEQIKNIKTPTFNDTVFDPQYLLLEDILFESKGAYSFISTLQVKWNQSGEWKELKHVYEQTKKSYNIRDVFNYQILLIEVIRDIFYVRFIDIYINNKPIDDPTMINLFESFRQFVSLIIPKNYPTNLYIPILELKNSLHRDIRIKNPSDGNTFSDGSIKLLLDKSTIKTCGESYGKVDKINGIDMSDFVRNILELKSFDHFVNTFELFSYDSNALDDYRLHRGNDETTIDRNGKNQLLCGHLSRLRANLTAFHFLIDGCHRVSVERINRVALLRDCDAEDAVLAVRKTIVLFYKTFSHDDEIGRILLPLLIGFSDRTDKGAKSERFLATRQTTALTLSLLENYELNNCAPRFEYNRQMYLRIVNDTRLYRPHVDGYFSHVFSVYRKQLSAEILERSKIYRSAEDRAGLSATTVDRLVPDTRSLHGDKLDWTSYTWDGTRELVDRAYANMSLVVIDHRVLARFQLFELKWIVSRTYKTLLFVLWGDASHNRSSNNLTVVENDLQRFLDLPFPESVSRLVRYTLRSYLDALKNRDETVLKGCEDDILRQLSLLSMSTEDCSNYRELNVHSLSVLAAGFHRDIEHLKRVLEAIDDSHLIDPSASLSLY